MTAPRLGLVLGGGGLVGQAYHAGILPGLEHHPGWDARIAWWVDSVDARGDRTVVVGWAFGVTHPVGLEFAMRDAQGMEWTDLAVTSVTRPEVREKHAEAQVRHIVRGVVRRGLAPMPSKAAVSSRVDPDVPQWFKA